MNEVEKNEEEVNESTEAMNAANEPVNDESEIETQAVSEEEARGEDTDKMAEELEKAKNDYLYLRAEYDNYRKRSIKEKAELIETAASRVLVNLLPLVDDFERGIAANEKSDDAESVKEGMKLIYDKFIAFLKKENVTEIETDGMPFDTDFHEAIAMVPAATDEQDGKVLDCVQKGYKLGDKVIRHAKVAVGKK